MGVTETGVLCTVEVMEGTGVKTSNRLDAAEA